MIIRPTPFPVYKVMIVTAILVGIIYIYLFLRKEKIPKKELIIFFILFFIISIVCGKLYTFIVTGFEYSSLSAYGGLIGVLFASIIYEYIYPRDGIVIKYTSLSLPIIYAFTKVGCFFAGCCYGIPYKGPLAVIYPLVMDESLFPIQLLEIIVFLLIFIICNTYRDKKNISYAVLLLIGIFKFSLDYLRYSHIGVILSPNQIFSIMLIIITLIVYIYRKKKNEI